MVHVSVCLVVGVVEQFEKETEERTHYVSIKDNIHDLSAVRGG